MNSHQRRKARRAQERNEARFRDAIRSSIGRLEGGLELLARIDAEPDGIARSLWVWSRGRDSVLSYYGSGR
jgi:hypothetical protein